MAHLDFLDFTSFYLYFALGSLRSEGEVGEMDLGKYYFFPKTDQFQHEEISDLKSFFAWEFPKPCATLVHNRFNFHPPNP